MILDRIREKARVSRNRSAHSVPLYTPEAITANLGKPLVATKKADITKRRKKLKDTTLFCRYELKYRIGEAKARAIAQYLKPYLHVDKYAKKTSNGSYPIASLYLDSDSLQLCQETLQGKKNRFKLRVRAYDDDPNSPCFFEIKRRINNVIMKSRARTEKSLIYPVLNNGPVPRLDCKKDEDALRQFQLYQSYLNARPITLVRYMREAYEGDSDNRVRITFDRELSFKTTTAPELSISGEGWTRAALDFVVLEIKFTARYPSWLCDMVKIFDLKQSAMSKYASSVRQSVESGYCAPQLLTYLYEEV